MVTKVHRDALQGDIASIRALLERVGGGNALSAASLRKRLAKLEAELQELDDEPDNTADVALIFDGAPVQGSSAIDADFAGRALQEYQELLTKQVATANFGGMAERGPVRQQAHAEARMNVTALVHGSFGFVLQEARADEPPLFPSATKQAVEEIAGLLADVTSPNEAPFEERLVLVDARIFYTLKRFVSHLHKAGSSLRIADRERELKLTPEGLGRAHERLKDTEVVEVDEVVIGELLGLVPIQRRFDFRREDNGEVVQGKVSQNLSRDYLDRLEREGIVAGHVWRAVIRTKTVEHPDGRHATVTRTLIDLVQQ